MLNVATKTVPQEVEGVWVNYADGVRFKVARAGNSAYLRAMDKAEAPYRKQIARNKLSSEKQMELNCRAMAIGILKDWEGIATDDGPLEFNEDNAYAVLRHNVELRDFIFEFAVESENYRRTQIEETAKKSPPL